MDDIKEILIEKGIIQVFDYQELDTELIDTYQYFEKKISRIISTEC